MTPPLPSLKQKHGASLLSRVVLVSTGLPVNPLRARMRPPHCIPFLFRPPLSLSKAPCAVRRLLVGHLFCAQYQQCTCVDPSLQARPSSIFSPRCPFICSLPLCLYFCFAKKDHVHYFLDSACMHSYTIFLFIFLT